MSGDKAVHYYILDEQTKMPVRAAISVWARWLESADRKVEDTALGEGVFVSTAFLGMAYIYNEGQPLLFATTVTGGSMNGSANYYATWEEAVAGHHEMVGVVLLAELGATDEEN